MNNSIRLLLSMNYAQIYTKYWRQWNQSGSREIWLIGQMSPLTVSACKLPMKSATLSIFHYSLPRIGLQLEMNTKVITVPAVSCYSAEFWRLTTHRLDAIDFSGPLSFAQSDQFLGFKISPQILATWPIKIGSDLVKIWVVHLASFI